MRLANTHQTAMTAAATSDPQIMPMNWMTVPGATQPGTRMAIHWRTITIRPGHTRGRGSAGKARADVDNADISDGGAAGEASGAMTSGGTGETCEAMSLMQISRGKMPEEIGQRIP